MKVCWGDETGYQTNACDKKRCLQKVDRAGRGGWDSSIGLSAGNKALARAAPKGHDTQSVC